MSEQSGFEMREFDLRNKGEEFNWRMDQGDSRDSIELDVTNKGNVVVSGVGKLYVAGYQIDGLISGLQRAKAVIDELKAGKYGK